MKKFFVATIMLCGLLHSSLPAQSKPKPRLAVVDF